MNLLQITYRKNACSNCILKIEQQRLSILFYLSDMEIGIIDDDQLKI